VRVDIVGVDWFVGGGGCVWGYIVRVRWREEGRWAVGRGDVSG
jgi:hypothetical protein